MRRDWGVYRNNIYFTGHLSIEEFPLWIYLLERITNWMCDRMSWFQYFHIYIHDPVFQLMYKKAKITDIILPYKFLLEKFPDQFEEGEYNQYIDEAECEEEKNRIKKFQDEDKELYEEFIKIYKKIEERYRIDRAKKLKEEKK
jgi:hypothetical protein